MKGPGHAGIVIARVIENATPIESAASVIGTTSAADIMEIETGTVATGTAMNITGIGTVIMTGPAGANGFAWRMKTAISTAGIANRYRSLYVNEMESPPACEPATRRRGNLERPTMKRSTHEFWSDWHIGLTDDFN
jgi:hypothetical protein